jgi:hypothetical protein
MCARGDAVCSDRPGTDTSLTIQSRILRPSFIWSILLWCCGRRRQCPTAIRCSVPRSGQWPSTRACTLTSPQVPVHSVADMIAMAKAKPGQLTYASIGNGSIRELGMENLKTITHTDMIEVAYKGSSPALIDLMSGQVTFMYCELPTAMGFIKSGKVRTLAMATDHRSALMPDLPSVSETVPGAGFTAWIGLVAPTGTPPAIIHRLQKEIDSILALPEIKTQFFELGSEPVGGTSEQFAELIKSETERWAKLIKTAGVQISSRPRMRPLRIAGRQRVDLPFWHANRAMATRRSRRQTSHFNELFGGGGRNRTGVDGFAGDT